MTRHWDRMGRNERAAPGIGHRGRRARSRVGGRRLRAAPPLDTDAAPVRTSSPRGAAGSTVTVTSSSTAWARCVMRHVLPELPRRRRRRRPGRLPATCAWRRQAADRPRRASARLPRLAPPNCAASMASASNCSTRPSSLRCKASRCTDRPPMSTPRLARSSAASGCVMRSNMVAVTRSSIGWPTRARCGRDLGKRSARLRLRVLRRPDWRSSWSSPQMPQR